MRREKTCPAPGGLQHTPIANQMWPAKCTNQILLEQVHRADIFPYVEPKTHKRKESMDTLPLELVDTIVRWVVDPLTLAVLRCVHPLWCDLVSRLPRREVGKRNKHRCVRSSGCAARYGRILLKKTRWSVLAWMVDCAGPFDQKNDLDMRACAVAAAHGDLVRLAHLAMRQNYRVDNMAAVYAARHGHMHVIEWLVAHEFTLPKRICTDMAQSGRIDMLRWAKSRGYAWDEHTFDRAVQYGHMCVLWWLKKQGCLPSARSCDIAAGSGRLPVLEWLRAGKAPWSARTVATAAAAGHLHIVEWAVKQGCLLNETAVICAARNGHLHVLMWLHARGISVGVNACDEAASGGHIDALGWMLRQGCTLGKRHCSIVAREGHLAALQWLRSNGCPWDADTCASAAKGGHLDVLRWAHTNGCPWDKSVVNRAIVQGHLHVLEWAVGVDPTLLDQIPSRIELAVRAQHKHVAKWLYGRMPQGDEKLLCDMMAECGHIPTLKWLRKQGCPCDSRVCENAVVSYHMAMLEWALDNGCPWRESPRARAFILSRAHLAERALAGAQQQVA